MSQSQHVPILTDNKKNVYHFHKQTTIDSFFERRKGPQPFQQSTFKSCPKSKKKRRPRRKVIKKADDSDEDDVIFVQEEICEDHEKRQTQRKVIKKEEKNKDDVIFVKEVIRDDQEIFSPQVIVEEGTRALEFKVTMKENEGSPSKKRKLIAGNNKRFDEIDKVKVKCEKDNIALTKSYFEVKTNEKQSKTQLMSSCIEPVVSFVFDQNDSFDFNESYAASLKSIIDIDNSYDELNSRQPDVVTFVENLDLIRNHLLKVRSIIKNSLRPNFENLLFENEKNLLLNFCYLNCFYQFICCKLFTHQSKWYNPSIFLDNLKYCTIKMDTIQIKKMLDILEENGFVKTNYQNEDLSYLLGLLKAEDVKNISNNLRIRGNLGNKQQHISAILKLVGKQLTLNPLKPMSTVVKDMVCKFLGPMFKITENFYNAFYKIHLMFGFACPELEIPHGIYTFIGELHRDNHIVVNHRVTDDVIFETAEEFSAFYKAYSYKEELIQMADKKKADKDSMLRLCEEICSELTSILNTEEDKICIKPGYLNRFTPGSKYVSALCFAVSKLSASFPSVAKIWIEKLLEQKYFFIRKRSLLYSQLAIIYKKHHKDVRLACETLVKGLEDEKLLHSDRCELIYHCQKYNKKNNTQYFDEVKHLFKDVPDPSKFPMIIIQGKSDSEEPLFEHINRANETEYLRVEEFAIRHYETAKGFRKGVHCEGALLNCLFHIFLSDVIHDDSVPKVFVSQLQQRPLDFSHRDFYDARRSDIDRRLRDVEAEWSSERLIDVLVETYPEVSRRKVGPVDFDLDTLIGIVRVLDRKVLSGMLGKLAKHYDECHAGLPDLFLWNDTQCKFVEVKGPGDTLSTKQKLWIQFLLDLGADVEVCHVQRMGGRK